METQLLFKNKELLLKDLSSRLPYEVKVRRYVYTTPTSAIESVELFGLSWLEELYAEEAEFKPYLFPLSSMTEEQTSELLHLTKKTLIEEEYQYEGVICDFYNKNHFDYRGLIPMGLAIDATGLNIY